MLEAVSYTGVDPGFSTKGWGGGWYLVMEGNLVGRYRAGEVGRGEVGCG